MFKYEKHYLLNVEMFSETDNREIFLRLTKEFSTYLVTNGLLLISFNCDIFVHVECNRNSFFSIAK